MVGQDKSPEDLVGFSADDIKANGWLHYPQLSRLAQVAPLSISEQDFLARCKSLHEIWQKVPNGFLKRICPVRYRDEFDAINSPSESEEVDNWLMGMGMRLARIGDEGAFFMAPEFIGPKELMQVKAEFLKFRDEYGPAVVLLDFIRQVKSDTLHLSPGEYIQLYDLDAAVAQSSTIEVQLKSLIGLIHNGAQRNTNHENLIRLMAHLCKDGYLILANKDTGAYQVTGKIEQLYAVLQFLDEHQVIPDNEIDDRSDPHEDLVDDAQNDQGDQGSGEPA